jgi:predicted ArsR family transcriptional regulator
LETLESTAEPLSLPGLVARVKLHENTVRGHLDALLTDGFVSR